MDYPDTCPNCGTSIRHSQTQILKIIEESEHPVYIVPLGNACGQEYRGFAFNRPSDAELFTHYEDRVVLYCNILCEWSKKENLTRLFVEKPHSLPSTLYAQLSEDYLLNMVKRFFPSCNSIQDYIFTKDSKQTFFSSLDDCRTAWKENGLNDDVKYFNRDDEFRRSFVLTQDGIEIRSVVQVLITSRDDVAKKNLGWMIDAYLSLCEKHGPVHTPHGRQLSLSGSILAAFRLGLFYERFYVDMTLGAEVKNLRATKRSARSATSKENALRPEKRKQSLLEEMEKLISEGAGNWLTFKELAHRAGQELKESQPKLWSQGLGQIENYLVDLGSLPASKQRIADLKRKTR